MIKLRREVADQRLSEVGDLARAQVDELPRACMVRVWLAYSVSAHRDQVALRVF